MKAAEYTLANYRALISIALAEGYKFEPFTITAPQTKTVFLRHDIDYSWYWARIIARENASLGIRGTYFIQLRSPLYNTFSFDSLDAIREIVNHGQHIALHLTIGPNINSIEEAGTLLEHDWAVLHDIVPECQKVFAWHNPSVWSGSDDAFLKAEFPGFINAYGQFAGGDHPYFSDSNIRYTLEQFTDILKRDLPTLQLALAPMQWVPGGVDMTDILTCNIIQKIRDAEVEFATNHEYSAKFGGRLSDEILDDFRSMILRHVSKSS